MSHERSRYIAIRKSIWTRETVPGIAQSLVLIALFLGISFVVQNALLLLQHSTNVSLDIASSLLLRRVIAWPLMLWIGLRWSGISFREACPLTRFPIHIVPAIIVASFGIVILLVPAASILIPVPEALPDMAQDTSDSSNLALFFSAVLAAPIAEELFFRGWMLSGYLRRYSITKAVWASAVVFALFHLNPWQALVAVPFGLGSAWLFLRTGSLVPGILGHMAANFSANFLLSPLVILLDHDAQTVKTSGHFPLSILAIGGAMAGIGGFILWRQLTKLQGEH